MEVEMATPAPDAPACRRGHDPTTDRFRDSRGRLACRGCKNEAKAAWKAANPDRVRDYCKRARAHKREKLQQWRATEKGRASVARQIARQAERQLHLTPEEREAQQAYYRQRFARLTPDRKAHKMAVSNEARRRRHAALWDEALARYTSGCACCGEAERGFLTVDHIDGGGAAHRKQIALEGFKGSGAILRWLKANDYPPGFQILCWNCNCGSARNGGVCPHKKESTT
jgi:hypothetical protein